MKETASQKSYLVHTLPGRARIAAPGLQENPSYCAGLTEQLQRMPGVRKVRGNPVSGRLLVSFDPSLLNLPQLLAEISRFPRKFPGNPGGGSQKPLAGSKQTIPVGSVPCPVPGKGDGGVPEPEDFPLIRQFGNVGIGGAVLTALSVKRFTRGVSPLAESPALFNLAAATAIVTGYPLLKSGLAGFFGRKQITSDLLLSAFSLGTLLLRESIPGLLIVWLANLNSLVQALLLAGSRRLLRQQGHAGAPDPEAATRPANCPRPGENLSANPQNEHLTPPASLYSSRMVPVAGGFAPLSGLLTRRFNRSLAVLLAASPAPAGLARPGALSAGLILARRARAPRLLNPPGLDRHPAPDEWLGIKGCCPDRQFLYFF